MVERCMICGETKETVLLPEEEQLADLLYDSLSDIADREGPGMICSRCAKNPYVQMLFRM